MPTCMCSDVTVCRYACLYADMQVFRCVHVSIYVSVPIWVQHLCTCRYGDILHVCVHVCCYKWMDACRHECEPVHRQVCTPACWSADVQECRYVCKHLYMFAILLVCMYADMLYECLYECRWEVPGIQRSSRGRHSRGTRFWRSSRSQQYIMTKQWISDWLNDWMIENGMIENDWMINNGLIENDWKWWKLIEDDWKWWKM